MDFLLHLYDQGYYRPSWGSGAVGRRRLRQRAASGDEDADHVRTSEPLPRRSYYASDTIHSVFHDNLVCIIKLLGITASPYYRPNAK